MDNTNEFLYPAQTYKLRGILFATHNELGRFTKEKQYGDKVEERLKKEKISYTREARIGDIQDIPDFILWDLIVLELKAKPFLKKKILSRSKGIYIRQT